MPGPEERQRPEKPAGIEDKYLRLDPVKGEWVVDEAARQRDAAEAAKHAADTTNDQGAQGFDAQGRRFQYHSDSPDEIHEMDAQPRRLGPPEPGQAVSNADLAALGYRQKTDSEKRGDAFVGVDPLIQRQLATDVLKGAGQTVGEKMREATKAAGADIAGGTSAADRDPAKAAQYGEEINRPIDDRDKQK